MLPFNFHSPRMCMVVCFRENAPVVILAADSKRSFWTAWTMMMDCRSQFAWQCASRAERECDPSGCRASGQTPELVHIVHVVLVPPLLVPPPSLGVLVMIKLWILDVYPCRPPHCPVDESSVFFAAPEACRRGRLSDGHTAIKLNKTQHTQRLQCGFMCPRHRRMQGVAIISFMFRHCESSRPFGLVFMYADKLVAQPNGCASSTSQA